MREIAGEEGAACNGVTGFAAGENETRRMDKEQVSAINKPTADPARAETER